MTRCLDVRPQSRLVRSGFNLANSSRFRYRHFRAKAYRQCPKFVTFEGNETVYGLNFSDEDEAGVFKHHLEKRFEQEQQSSK